MRWRLNVVRSLGLDPGHHEEIKNCLENMIHIMEIIFWVSEMFRSIHMGVLEGFGVFQKVLEGSIGFT